MSGVSRGMQMTKHGIDQCAVQPDGSARIANAVWAHEQRSRAGLLRDQRGISTAEYAVLFVVLCIGSLATWRSLSKSINTQVTNGSNELNSVLQSHIQAANASNDSAANAVVGMGAKPALGMTANGASSNAARALGSQVLGNQQQAAAASGNLQGFNQALNQQQATNPSNGNRGLGQQQQATNPSQDTQAFNKAMADQQQRASASHDKSRGNKSPTSTLKGQVKGDMQQANRSAAGLLKDDQDRAHIAEPGTNKGDVKGDVQQANLPVTAVSKGEVKGDMQQANPAVAKVPKADHSTPAVSAVLKGGQR